MIKRIALSVFRIYLTVGLVIFGAGFALSCASHKQVEISQGEKNELIVLIHGFGRSNVALRQMDERLNELGYNTVRIGYRSITRSMDEILNEVNGKLDSLPMEKYEKVHFVGHSLGGLLARSYVDNRTPANLGQVINVGSPSKGTPVVEHLKEKWWTFIAGDAAWSLGASGSQFLSSLKKPEYNLGVIAGVRLSSKNESVLNGPDDGLVQLESTRVEGMSDFVIVRSGHSQLRYDYQTYRQIVFFLQNGKFDHGFKEWLAKREADGLVF